MPPNTAAAVAYITAIPAIIFLVVDPYKRMNFVRFHAWQNLLLNITMIVYWIAIAIVSVILGLIHLGILSLLLMFLNIVVFLAFFIIWVMAVIKASKGERWHIPLIGGIAENMANKQ
jgi:uncharacterized membrane protein